MGHLGLGLGLGLLLATARRHSRHRCGWVALRECDAGGRAEAHDGTAAGAGGGGVVRVVSGDEVVRGVRGSEGWLSARLRRVVWVVRVVRVAGGSA